VVQGPMVRGWATGRTGGGTRMEEAKRDALAAVSHALSGTGGGSRSHRRRRSLALSSREGDRGLG
jgi:hypothetical protein